MPQTHQEGRLRFHFPDEWKILRAEKSAYFTRRFQSFCGGCKEVDFLGWDGSTETLWLIEVKDYTTDRRTKSLDLCEEIALKARDALSMLVGAAANANPDRAETRNFSQTALPPGAIRVVLHLEEPSKPSKLFPAVKPAADRTQMLRTKVRCLDPHARVVSTSLPGGVPWVVEWNP